MDRGTFGSDTNLLFRLTGNRWVDYIKNILVKDNYNDTLTDYYVSTMTVKRIPQNLKCKLNKAYLTGDESSIQNTYSIIGAVGSFEYKGRGFRYGLKKSGVEWPSWNFDKDSIKQENIDAFKKIAKYCKDNDIELVCVQSALPPYRLQNENMDEVHEYFTELCSEYNVPFYDLNYLKNEYLSRTDDDYVDLDGHMMGELADRQSAVLGQILISENKEAFFYDAPIDGKLPRHRIDIIVETLKPSAILADADNLALAEELAQGIPVFELEKAMQENTDEKKLQEIRRNMIMTDPLYVIFTSGSTGKPKGVITSHQSLICYIESYVSVMEIDENDRLGNQSPLDYIAAIRDIYVPLYKGCSSVIIPKEYFMEPNRLFDYMNEHKVTSVGWSVSAFTVALSLGVFEEVKLNTLKKICFSGSVMPASCLSVWQQNLPDAKFVNQYGPTEATASCTYYKVDHLVSQDEQLPIGRPYNNYRVFLL